MSEEQASLFDSLRLWIASKIAPPLAAPARARGEVRAASTNQIFFKKNAETPALPRSLEMKQIAFKGMQEESGPVIFHKTLSGEFRPVMRRIISKSQ